MLIRAAIAIAMALSVIAISDVWASCKKVELPEIIGVAVFKHYRHDGGEVVDVLVNNDVVRHYRTLGARLRSASFKLAGHVRPVGCLGALYLSGKFRVPYSDRQACPRHPVHSICSNCSLTASSRLTRCLVTDDRRACCGYTGPVKAAAHKVKRGRATNQEGSTMRMLPATAMAVALSAAVVSDAQAWCRRVEVPPWVAVPV